jgi:hypothetical protein
MTIWTWHNLWHNGKKMSLFWLKSVGIEKNITRLLLAPAYSIHIFRQEISLKIYHYLKWHLFHLFSPSGCQEIPWWSGSICHFFDIPRIPAIDTLTKLFLIIVRLHRYSRVIACFKGYSILFHEWWFYRLSVLNRKKNQFLENVSVVFATFFSS